MTVLLAPVAVGAGVAAPSLRDGGAARWSAGVAPSVAIAIAAVWLARAAGARVSRSGRWTERPWLPCLWLGGGMLLLTALTAVVVEPVVSKLAR